ncbi:tetratricopeptide repeat protein [Thiohalobacter sp. IOR34]|uniref:tetratricopeptide repeat-containing sulfotransferase family protein n=1 Tax=Thiohalobacter sp. IOR34 TaxID=3057176 RepID=UPI0025B246BA|nr:tetratricopeptide repeat-containing sulfotransferase family protein [Thiohalobacter sp. IOR34]WJW75197.1 tetratricopeptide repeat protein [Thiohalobacter sp. IOR34]
MKPGSFDKTIVRIQKMAERGQIREALETLQQLPSRNDPRLLTLEGTLLGRKGDPAGAEKCLRKAVALAPESAEIHANLGNALLALGRSREAADSYRQATRLQPALTPAWLMLGMAERQSGNLDKAEAAFRKAVELSPSWPDAWYHLGNLYQHRGKPAEAVRCYRQLLTHHPEHAEGHHRLGISLASLGQTPESEKHLRRALELAPDFHRARINLAMVLTTQGRRKEALQCCTSVLEKEPGHLDATIMAANLLEQSGEADKAYERIRPLLDAGVRNANLALALAALARPLGLHDEAIAAIEDLLESPAGLSHTSLKNLHFNLGRLLEEKGEYDRAFEHYRRGNEVRSPAFDRGALDRETGAVLTCLDREFFQRAPRAGHGSRRPIFIVGMPRSGTSLVEQILASHPEVFGAGELAEIGQIAKALGERRGQPYPLFLDGLEQDEVDKAAARYLSFLEEKDATTRHVTDKMPGNFMYLGLIALLFPDARVIHCVRDPLDTCLSCYFLDFFEALPWSYRLEDLATYYKGYERVMTHWKAVLPMPVLDVQYEALVRDPEPNIRKLLEFCELEWNDACLRFHETKRTVATASYDQVRRPLYTSSIGRWKRFARHIGPLIEALGKSLDQDCPETASS